ncbi:MAG: FG-GAP repeat protein [Planctomycetota bacterium]|nr:FG-GAP repeat protein [Planctomycetota bacterium]
MLVHPFSGRFRATLGVSVFLCVCFATTCAWGHCVANEWQKLLASDGTAQDRFGEAVSISGDIAVIGARWDDHYGSASGSAYVFRYDGANWVEEAKLLASDGAIDDDFGYSVSISGDLVVIGAAYDDDNGNGSGSAYVFRYDGANWTEEAKLLASDGAAYDRFGQSVSISGEIAVIGASADDDSGSYSGSAYVFRYDGANWIEEAKLLASDGAAADRFGCSVAISGDIGVIGAEKDDDNDDDSGSAYVFRRVGANWTEEAKLLASDGAAEDDFGCSVSISGEIAVIGASGDDDHGSKSGSAYVFRRSGANWTEEAKLLTSDGGFHYFGYSVSISDHTAVIGAYFGDGNDPDSGSAYVFRYDGAEWIEESKLTASDGSAGDFFGESVSISGDTAVIGATLDDDLFYESGSAYIFHGLSDYDENGILDICDIDFDGPVDVESIGEPTDVVSTDFTGSNGNDIAIAELGATPEEPGYLVLLLNDGSGVNFTKMSTAVGKEPSAFAVADFDGINGPDAAVCNSADNNVTILLNDGEGNGTFELGVDVPVGTFPSDIAAGDFDGDDDIDLAVTNRDDNTVKILTNDGTGTFTVTDTFGVGNAPSAIVAADFNDDELIDLAVANEADDTVRIYLNDGGRGFDLHVIIEVDLGPGVLEPEDLDDDEHIDMVVGNRGSDKVTLLLNDGAANFDTMTFTVGNDPASIAIADVDVDGDEDVLVVADTPESRAVRILRNDLNGGEELDFTLFADLAEDPDLKLTAAKDLNGNYVPDVIAVSGPAEGASPAAGGRPEGSVRVVLNGRVICPGDFDDDGEVNTADLLHMLGCWGTDCGDINLDGSTDTADLLILLGAWGDCPG